MGNQGDIIEQLLGPAGALASAKEGYEDRPAQRQMAIAVANALETGRHLCVEAGTGTGKTLAYLLPAILSERRVVVSTATKALQDQVFEKDLPLISSILDRPFSAARLKGRSNYVCLLRKKRFDAEPTFARRAEVEIYDLIDRWVGSTETGDRSELAEVPEHHSAWSQITSSSDSCVGQKCEHYDNCFIMKERQRAAASQLVVVNHHLFFADLALKSSSAGSQGGAEVIPPYEAVIFDEAHALEEIATLFFGVSFSRRAALDLCRDAGRAGLSAPTLSQPLGEVAGRVERSTRAFFADLPREDGRCTLDERLLDHSADSRADLVEALGMFEAVCANQPEDKVDEIGALGRRAREQQAALLAVCQVEEPGFVHWYERRPKAATLSAAPIEVGSLLQEMLLKPVDSCIFTSATLASGGHLNFFLERIGLTQEGEASFEQEELILASPFHFEQQAALYVPEHLCEPNDPDFVDQVADQVEALCAISGGRAFVLCTSRRNMLALYERLEDRLPWPVLLQGEAPKGALLERFREEPSVLVATSSFWEGVDVPGEALSLVVIDKLPFASPGDPLVAARLRLLEATGHPAFMSYQVPSAALALKQGFGRLIRSQRDRGIVAICDTRLITRRYRSYFLRTLPPCPRFRNILELQGWWEAQDARLDREGPG